jgi:hypothetical protein
VHTDREVMANRLDIIVENREEKTCTLLDVAIPADRNAMQKETEKKLKYKSLCIEVHKMWSMKCMIIPVIVRSSGRVKQFKRLIRKPYQGDIRLIPKHSWNIMHNVKSTAV